MERMEGKPVLGVISGRAQLEELGQWGISAIFLDGVEVSEGSVKGWKRIRHEDCVGHFKGDRHQVCPGYILIEAACQMAYFGSKLLGGIPHAIFLLTNLRASFYHSVLPEETVFFYPEFPPYQNETISVEAYVIGQENKEILVAEFKINYIQITHRALEALCRRNVS